MVAEPVVEPTTTPAVSLPDLPEMRAWIETTKQKRAKLQERADRLREEFEPLRKKLAGVERSIKVLDHFLGQVAVEDAPQIRALRGSGRAGRPLLPDDQWSRKYAACRGCGSSDKAERPHKAHGYCKACYDRHVTHDEPEEASA